MLNIIFLLYYFFFSCLNFSLYFAFIYSFFFLFLVPCWISCSASYELVVGRRGKEGRKYEAKKNGLVKKGLFIGFSARGRLKDKKKTHTIFEVVPNRSLSLVSRVLYYSVPNVASQVNSYIFCIHLVRDGKKNRLILPRSFTIPLPPLHDCANSIRARKKNIPNPVDNQLIMKNIIFTDLTFSLLLCTVFFPTVSLCPLFFINLLRFRAGIFARCVCICLYINRKCIQYYPYFQFKERLKFGATFVYFFFLTELRIY